MDFTLDEIEDMVAEKISAWKLACVELESANSLLNERKRIENLKNSLGNISADDIARIQTLLAPSSIQSSEDVRIA